MAYEGADLVNAWYVPPFVGGPGHDKGHLAGSIKGELDVLAKGLLAVGDNVGRDRTLANPVPRI